MLLACTACGTILEVVRFADRRLALFALDATIAAVILGSLLLLRRHPQLSIAVGIAAVNLVGLALNGYHLTIGAPVAVSIWTLTGLLCAAAFLLGWGWRPQLLASVGAASGYCLLLFGTEAAVSWLAGSVYLAWVIGLSVAGAELISRYLAAQFELVGRLSERESRLQSYFDLALVGTAILSPHGRVLEVNNELCRILGYSSDELLGTSWNALILEEERQADQELLDRIAAGAIPAGWREGGLSTKHGDAIHAAISLRALPGPLGQADHLIVVVQDLTERRRAEQQREEALVREQTARRDAEAASRAKDEFLAMVSHELRTPLTTILGWPPLLRAGRLSGEDQRHAFDAIERSGRSLAQLIDDLLDVSRIVSGKLRLAVETTDLGAALQGALDSMRLAADAKRVQLQLSLPPRPEYVLGDRDRLQQVLWNLISNAIKFTPTQGHVGVELRREDDSAVIRVRDNGNGIDPELLPHVFERFWQADATTTRRHGGLGLGLAIVRHLVELHGGTVAVDSPGLGRGAVFTVRLPRAAAPTAAAAEDRGAVDPTMQALRGMRVLVVDDELDAQEVARRALELYGVEVRTAASTSEALAILERWSPAVLVSDVAMPDEDGIALIRRLRRREAEHGGHLRALAFTALARAEDRSRLLAGGFDGYVAKPVDPSELADAVAALAAGASSADGPQLH